MPNPCYSPRLDAALLLATRAFRDRIRKGTNIPYLTHLLSVLVLVMEADAPEDVCIAAVLHDYVEDIEGATVQEVEDRFGARVASLVASCTDSREHPKPPWRGRKEAHLLKMASYDAETRLLLTADKCHNLSTILRDLDVVGDALWSRFTGGRDGTLWYYQSVCHVLGQGWSHPLLDRLRRDVDTLTRRVQGETRA